MKNLIVANWKMNPQGADEARRLTSGIEQGLLGVDRKLVEVVICPPYVFLPLVKHSLHLAALGAQDVFFEESGPFTGQISPRQLLQFNATHAIIGHSEMRTLGETDAHVNAKVKAAIRHGIHPILCVGFGAKKSSSVWAIKQIVKKQLQLGLKGVNTGTGKLTIAYEQIGRAHV